MLRTMQEPIQKMFLLLVAITAFAATASAKSLTYTIDHGTVGVVSSGSGEARLVIQATGNCKNSPYSVVTDGVLAIKGAFDLSRERSMPLDYTQVVLTCSDVGITVKVNQAEKSGLF